MSATRTLQVTILGDASSGQKALSDLSGQGDKTSGRIAGAFGGVLSSIGSAAGGVLGPVSQVFTTVGEKVTALGKEHVDLAGKMGLVGAAGLALGTALTLAGSKDLQAQAQLKQAIENTGQSYAEYQKQIDEAIKHQENFGYTANQTMNALQQLTQATGDPQKALENLGHVADLAAARHEDLTTATSQYIQVLDGKGTKTLQQFGIAASDTTTDAKNLATAQNDLATATDKVHTAQQKLDDLEAQDAAKKKLTIKDEQNLRDAKQNLNDALAKQQEAQQKVTDAQGKLNDATAKGSNADQLNAKTTGQAQASMSGFRGEVEKAKAKVEDFIGAMGGKYGAVIQSSAAALEIGAAGLNAFGSVMGIVRGHLAATAVAEDVLAASEGGAAAAAGAEAAGLTAAGAGADVAAAGFWAAAAGEAALLLPMALITAAVVGIGIGITELALHWHTVWTGMSAAAVDTWHFVYYAFVSPLEGFIGSFAPFVQRAFKDVAGFLISPFRLAEDAIASSWNSTLGSFSFSVPGWVPGIGGDKISFPKMPVLDTGGIVTGPTIAALALNSVPEVVVPLPAFEKAMAPGAEHGGPGSSGQGDTYVHVEVQSNADPFQIGDEVAWGLKTSKKAA